MGVVATHAPQAPPLAVAPVARGPKRRWTRFVLPTYSWVVILYLVIPIAVMIIYSFNKVATALPQVSFGWNGFTTQWYSQWSQIPGLTSAFFLSLKVAAASTAIATVLGTMIALALVRYRLRGQIALEQVLLMNIA